jgi:hypothetical protein
VWSDGPASQLGLAAGSAQKCGSVLALDRGRVRMAANPCDQSLMAEKTAKPSTVGKTLKLFLLIFVVLLVPVVMDQAEVDRETVRMVGRVAAGITAAMCLYGIFNKLLKAFAFVVLGLIGLTVLVSEGQLKAPRVKALFGGEHSSGK